MDVVNICQVVDLWVKLLLGPIPRVLQTTGNHAVKSTTCDCLANIGPKVYQQLPVSNRHINNTHHPSHTSILVSIFELSLIREFSRMDIFLRIMESVEM